MRLFLLFQPAIEARGRVVFDGLLLLAVVLTPAASRDLCTLRDKLRRSSSAVATSRRRPPLAKIRPAILRT
jgi:hypothetical protein